MTTRKKSRSATNIPVETPKVETLDWVECSTCGKWRKVPPSIKVDSLPEIWTCAQNHWAPAFARCSVPQEDEEKLTPLETVPAPIKRGRPQTTIAEQPSKKVTQWVQCERKNCGKWRKVKLSSCDENLIIAQVPAHIDVNKLSGNWYCERNYWDPDRRYCDAAEYVSSLSHPSSLMLILQGK